MSIFDPAQATGLITIVIDILTMTLLHTLLISVTLIVLAMVFCIGMTAGWAAIRMSVGVARLLLRLMPNRHQPKDRQ